MSRGVSRSSAEYMREALSEAEKAYRMGEVPIGAVVVSGGRIVGRGGNRVIMENDPTAHAEIAAIREAARNVGNYRLIDTELYVTVEPCVMCAGAIIQARIKRLIYGAPDPRMGGVDSLYKILGDVRLNHRVEVTAGILEDEAVGLIKQFFETRR